MWIRRIPRPRKTSRGPRRRKNRRLLRRPAVRRRAPQRWRPRAAGMVRRLAGRRLHLLRDSRAPKNVVLVGQSEWIPAAWLENGRSGILSNHNNFAVGGDFADDGQWNFPK